MEDSHEGPIKPTATIPRPEFWQDQGTHWEWQLTGAEDSHDGLIEPVGQQAGTYGIRSINLMSRYVKILSN